MSVNSTGLCCVALKPSPTAPTPEKSDIAGPASQPSLATADPLVLVSYKRLLEKRWQRALAEARALAAS